jgi:hypothetical protein
MRVSLRNGLVLALGMFGAVVGTPARAADGEYLFVTLKKPAYRRAWNSLLRGQRVDSWLSTYAHDYKGPATPSKTVVVGGVHYQANGVCKQHDCGDNQFMVFFAPRGRRAWGLLLTRSTQRRFFGSPDAAMRAALLRVINE